MQSLEIKKKNQSYWLASVYAESFAFAAIYTAVRFLSFHLRNFLYNTFKGSTL